MMTEVQFSAIGEEIKCLGPQAISLILVPSSCYVYSTLYSDHGGAGKWIHLDCQQEAGVGG